MPESNSQSMKYGQQLEQESVPEWSLRKSPMCFLFLAMAALHAAAASALHDLAGAALH